MSEADEAIRDRFLDSLDRFQDWLEGQRIPFAVLGSVAVAAHVDRGESLDFNRSHAFDPTQQIPDIDLLVPRTAVGRVQERAEQMRNAALPIKIDTVGAEVYIDFRPDEPYSYLTHRKINFPVRSELFTPQAAPLFDRQIQTLDPHTLLHTFGTIGGVVRKKDVPKIEALAGAIATGLAPTRFSGADVRAFDQYRVLREQRYPVFMRSKKAWESLLGNLPPQVSNAVKHYVSPAAQRVMGKMNRGRDQLGR